MGESGTEAATGRVSAAARAAVLLFFLLSSSPHKIRGVFVSLSASFPLVGAASRKCQVARRIGPDQVETVYYLVRPNPVCFAGV